MKKIFVSMLVMLCCLASASFAEDTGAKGPKMAVSVDTGYLLSGLLSGGFGIGGAFEYKILNGVSAAAKFGYYGLSVGYASASVTAPGFEGRWYFMSPGLSGGFLGVGISYYLLNVNLDYTSLGYDKYSFSGGAPVLDINFGYKWIIGGESSGVVIEPYAGYGAGLTPITIKIYNDKSLDFPVAGLEFGCRLGWAF